MILLATPITIFGAVGSLAVRGLEPDIFGQIGLLLLVGLSAQNSMLLVSSAEDLRRQGEDVLKAAQDAARLRMRPILITTFAFITGSIPLAIATGANARVSRGTVVIGGLVMATFVTPFVTPTMYFAFERLFSGEAAWRGGRA